MLGAINFLFWLLMLGTMVPLTANLTGPQQQMEKKLPDSYDLVLKKHDDWPSPIRKIPPFPLPDGRVIVTVGDTVYMIGSDGHVLWNASLGNPIISQPVFRADRNEIAVICDDLLFVLVDASTGKRLRQDTMNGRAGFTDIKAFRDGYIVKIDLTAYRNWPGGFGPPKSDRLDYFGPVEDDRCNVEFPVGAQLLVAGDRVYAVKFGEIDVSLQEINVPACKEKNGREDRLQ